MMNYEAAAGPTFQHDYSQFNKQVVNVTASSPGVVSNGRNRQQQYEKLAGLNSNFVNKKPLEPGDAMKARDKAKGGYPSISHGQIATIH